MLRSHASLVLAAKSCGITKNLGTCPHASKTILIHFILHFRTHSHTQVLEQVHPKLSAKDDAVCYVEGLCLRLLAMLVAKPPPRTIQVSQSSTIHRKYPLPFLILFIFCLVSLVVCRMSRIVSRKHFLIR